MGWSHDFRDVARNRSHLRAPRAQASARFAARLEPSDPELGIPRILRRRARWVGARLRHTRT
ncbi:MULTISPECIES: hypothetical protein [unclassified Streptomyces]|uniref:hypothetical protein n=1 Tax=unclassified Streptomyces TaxID=2593676 RepID=UPI002DDBD8D2|nr:MULTISPECIES: hypothetical protein [unclassified Streptomyces]WSA93281.1 hypothetical protein OIE63_18105 [Streptomyces sp. NBC_01795]WSB77670.1 hypothetical protein OHB04_19035 [Streptomyces sp. NBC_01775]WSS14080.1 hypothetical protein OG533_21010 [Streptomyces sp. NBC_01186]WSS42919.1 hypothetical protein OG220_21800 [Streptomyces sp. NBC_01187]